VGQGIVTEIRRDVIQVEHETIPGFMVALITDFRLGDRSMAEGLQAGDRVVFSVQQTEWDYFIIAIGASGDTPSTAPPN